MTDELQPRLDLPLLARSEEMALLTALIDHGEAGEGRARSAVVAGPPGVGKTRLLRESLDHARRAGMSTVLAIATRSAATTPYSALAHLAPQTPISEHTGVSSWYSEVAQALREAPGGRTVLGVDDAHLLDPGSAALLLHLALTGAATVVVTLRRGEQPPDPITALWKDGIALRVDLQPFSVTEVERLLDAMLPGDVAPRAKRRLASVSGGNVLFARELVRGALESGSLRRIEGVWRWDGEVVLAPRLVDAVGARLQDLEPAGLRALGAVALGEPLAVNVAERVCAASALTRLEELDLIAVTLGDECRVTHPLYGEVALARLGAVAHRQLRRELTDALASHDGLSSTDTVRIATWRLELDDDVPGDLLVDAAKIANAAFDHPLAQRLADAALHHGAGPSAALAAAIARNGQNRFAEAERILAAAEPDLLAAGDVRLCRRYLPARQRALQHGLGRFADTAAMMDRFEAAHCGADEHAAQGRRLVTAHRTALFIEQGRLSEVIETAAPLLDDPAVEPHIALLAAETTGEALAYQGMTERSRAIQDRLAELARTGPPELRRAASSAVGQQVLCLIIDGQPGQAVEIATAMREYALLDADAVVRAMASLGLGTAQLRHGTLATARRTLLDAIAGFEEADISGHVGWAYAMLAQADALLGDPVGAREHLSRANDRKMPVARTMVDHVVGQALTEMAEGRTTCAVNTALEGAAAAGELAAHRVRMLHLAARLGAPATPIARELAEIAAQVESPSFAHKAEQVRAMAEADGDGLAAVCEHYIRDGELLLAAEAAAQAADAYRATGRAPSATRSANRSAALVARCEGARTPVLTPVVPAGAELSRREMEVARLAATGRSNVEIAERLVLSVRTVESHLYRVFAKLGVTARDQLADLIQ